MTLKEKFESNQYEIITPETIKRILNCKISEKNIESMKYLVDDYLEFLFKTSSLTSDQIKLYTESIKYSLIIENHLLENEEEKKIVEYIMNHKLNALEYLKDQQSTINAKTIKTTHGILMIGTASYENKDFKFRQDNNKFVGYYENNEEVVQFFPAHTKDIKEITDLIIESYNAENSNLFSNPLLIHGAIATSQLFDDGNTRLGRLFQNVKLYKNTARLIESKKEPARFYMAKAYSPYRKKYRDLIAEMAINPSEEIINQWILFNFRRIEDQLYYNNFLIDNNIKNR